MYVISFILMFSGVAVFGYMENTAALSASIIAGAIGMAFANIDKMEHFKGAGFEAHMKKAVEEAYATTKSLRDLGCLVAEAISAIMAVENKFAGLGWDRKLNIKNKIDHLLRESGLEENKIYEASALFDEYLKYDHARKIVSAITQEASIPVDIRQEAEKLIDFSKSADIGETYTAPPAEFKRFIETNEINSNSVEESIKDYEYYLNKNSLRRTEEWK